MCVHCVGNLCAILVSQSYMCSILPKPSLPWAAVAVKLIAEATAKARAGILNLGQQAPPFFPSGQHYVQDKVFIGLDQAPEEFHLNEKLQGPGVGGVGCDKWVWGVGWRAGVGSGRVGGGVGRWEVGHMGGIGRVVGGTLTLSGSLHCCTVGAMVNEC